MDKKSLIYSGIVLLAVQSMINLGIFVTFPQMASYAVSKDSFQMLCEKLTEVQQDVKEIKSYLLNKK